MMLIGIDTGKHTGFAVWDSAAKRLTEVSKLSITQAMEQVRMIADVLGRYNVHLIVEDARKRRWFGDTGSERLKGAGSVCRDAAIWEDWCREQGIPCTMVAPKNNRTKLSAVQFRRLTGWTGRTSEHGRDAAMLVFGR